MEFDKKHNQRTDMSFDPDFLENKYKTEKLLYLFW